MSEPAIYVVVRDGAWFHTGDNLGGYEVDHVLALGPAVTTRYVDALVRARAAVVAADPNGFWTACCSGDHARAGRLTGRRSWMDWVPAAQSIQDCVAAMATTTDHDRRRQLRLR